MNISPYGVKTMDFPCTTAEHIHWEKANLLIDKSLIFPGNWHKDKNESCSRNTSLQLYLSLNVFPRHLLRNQSRKSPAGPHRGLGWGCWTVITWALFHHSNHPHVLSPLLPISPTPFLGAVYSQHILDYTITSVLPPTSGLDLPQLTLHTSDRRWFQNKLGSIW